MKLPFIHHEKDKHLNLDQLRMLIEEERKILSPVEYQILLNILNIREKRAKDIMLPLSEVLAVKPDLSTEAFKNLVRGCNFSYIPMYETRIDRLVGIVDVVEILYDSDRSKLLKDYILPAHYIPDSKKVLDLLPELQRMQHPVAIVVNEHGSCIGIATLDDLIAEVIGEVGGQDSEVDPQIEPSSDGSWVIDARCKVEKVNRKLRLSLPLNTSNTVGGLVMNLSGKIPDKEEEIDIDKMRITVLETHQFGISKVRLTYNGQLTSETD